MSAFLLAAIREASHAPAGTAVGLLAESSKRHAGRVSHAGGDSSIVQFAIVPQAVECALAVQAKIADYNRGKADELKVSARVCVHVCASGGAEAGVGEGELKAAAFILDSTPAGRVLMSRQAYTQAQGAQVCCFIPLGLEYFSGLPDPLEVFEAVPLVGRGKTLASMPRRAPPAGPAAPLLAATPSEAAPPDVFGPLGMAAASVSALVLFGLRGGVNTLLSPLSLVNFVFHLAGNMIFGLPGGDLLGHIGGPLMQAAMPAAAAAHFWARSEPKRRDFSLVWLGQSLLSLGYPLANGFVDPDSFAAGIRTELLDVLGWGGLGAHAYACGQTLSAAGCLVMGFALVSLVGPYVLPAGKR